MITPTSPGPLLVVMAADARSMRRMHAHAADGTMSYLAQKDESDQRHHQGRPQRHCRVSDLLFFNSSVDDPPSSSTLRSSFPIPTSFKYHRLMAVPYVYGGPRHPCDSPWRQLESRTACATCRGSSSRRPLHEAAGGWLRTNRRSCIRRSGGCRSKLTNPSSPCGMDVMRMAQVARVCPLGRSQQDDPSTRGGRLTASCVLPSISTLPRALN